MKKFLLVLFSLCLLTGCEREKEKLILVTEAGFAPYEYYSNGEVVGVDIDIAKEIAKYLDKDLVIKDVAFDSIISEVKTGKSDIGAAGISFTEERQKEVNFTVSYAESKQVIIVNDGSDINNANNLSGKKVAVQLGSVADDYLTNNYPSVDIIREKKFLSAIQDLKDNKVDALVMDEVPALRLVSDDMIILEEPLLTDSYGMVVSKGNEELLNACNNVIRELKENGKIDEYLLYHLGVNEERISKNGLINRFYSSVIYDGRYKFILEGLKNTLLIALGAVLIGIVLGLIAAISNNVYKSTGKLKLLADIAKAYVTVIRGTPSTLQLMIIYYVIFKQTSINIVLVGIIAFGINSGAYVAEIIRAGINSIDKGQWEAGYSLGLSYPQVVSKIIMPQSIKNILPALGNEFITLVKETSIGAYIGIVELTKASDIIASRTYDYFFPLILIAIIYLIITLCLSKLINKMEVRLNNARG
ncbi:MAG: ABC transporter substrate-binding protein/permease [Bacilli bacterium]|nr:ABC transporter substrate-binding protein/permease [Bacilli bacterium]